MKPNQALKLIGNLETEYQKQIKYIFKKPNNLLNIANQLKGFANFIFVLIPRAIGRFFLDILNRDKAQDFTALLSRLDCNSYNNCRFARAIRSKQIT